MVIYYMLLNIIVKFYLFFLIKWLFSEVAKINVLDILRWGKKYSQIILDAEIWKYFKHVNSDGENILPYIGTS